MIEIILKVIKYIVLISVLIYSLIILSIFILPLFNLNPLSVNSDNMEPNYTVGSLVLLKETDVTKIYPDDVIAYTSYDEKYGYDISRIVNKNIEKRHFEIRDDNIADSTSEVSYVRVLGKVVYDIPYIGYVNNFISETRGKIISSTVILGLLVIPYLIKFLLDD
jgi:signal peptidase I